jgi:hypothetical protein
MSKPDDGRTYLAGCKPWDRGRMEAAPACPVCQGGVLTVLTYCLWCNQCGLDRLVAAGRAKLKGEPVGSRINPGWEAPEGTKLKPNPRGLKGGRK